MFTNNKFGKFDAVADAIKSIAEADYKAKMEELKGQQHKIDKNKNNKVDADDFKILRGEKKGMKKEEVEESNNPFDLKNYKSQLPTKPGEKAGFDSKKVSTGTIYSRKPVKDEPMKKEEIDPNDTTTDTLKGREKTSGNPFLSKKVKMDVPDNVKEEAEQIDELTLSDLVARSRKQKFDTEAEMKHHRLVDGKPSVPKRVGSKDIHLHHIGTGNSTGENAKYKVVAAGAKSPLKAKVGSTISGKKVNDHMDTSGEGGTVHVHTARPKAHFMDDDMHEEVQHIDELSKDTLKSYSSKAKKDSEEYKKAGYAYDSDPDERAFAPKAFKKAASRTAGAAKADSKIKEDIEQVDEANTETKQEFLARQQRLAAAHSETQKDPKRLARLMKIPGYSDAMKLAQKTTQKEEVEDLDERTLSKGETAEKERIVKGMKKSLAGFKARYGDKAKSVMYATATARAKK